MESQEQSSGDVVTVGEDSHPITQAIDTVEVTHAGATTPAANTMDPPTIPLAPMKRMRRGSIPLADGLMYVVVFVGGFVGVGCRHALDMLLPVGQRDAVRCGHVCVEYGRLLPVRDADRIHGDRFVAASPGAAGCQPWCWAWLARWAFDDVRRDAGNDGRSARAAYRQCAWLSCGKFCRRFAHCRRRRGSDAGTAVTEYSKAGSGCVFSCFRVRILPNRTRRAYAM